MNQIEWFTFYSTETLSYHLNITHTFRNHSCNYVCGRCLSAYTSQNFLIKHERCDKQERTIIKFSIESHLYGKKRFHLNPLCFWIYAGCEADNEIDNSNIGNETSNILKQNPVCNVFYIVSELNDVSKSANSESNLNYDIIDSFVDEVIKLENRMVFFFENILRKIIIGKEDEEQNRKTHICSF